MAKTINIAIISLLLLLGWEAAAATVDEALARFNSEPGAANANAFFEQLSAEEFLDEPVKLATAAPVDTLRQQVWYWAAEYYYDAQRYDLAERYALKALPLCRAGHNEVVHADCLNLIAITYIRLGDYPHAARYARDCYSLDRASGDPDRMSSSLNTLATIYMGARQPQEAQKYVLQGIEQCRKIDNPARLATLLGTASEVHHSLEQEEKALDYARQAYDIETALKREDRAAMRLTQMAAALHWLKRYDEARDALLKAMPVLEQSGNYPSLAVCYNQLGFVMLDNTPAQPARAAEYFNKALHIVTQLHDIYNESHARLGLYRALKESDPAEAMRQMELYKALKDSIYNRDVAMSMGMHDAMLDNEQLKAQNRSQKATTRRAVILGVAVALTLALLALALWWWMRRRQRQLTAQITHDLDALREEYRRLHVRYVNDHEAGEEGMSEFEQRAIAAVNDLIDNKKVSVDELAKCMGMSMFQLRSQLTALGKKPNEFIMEHRMARAMQLLTHHRELNVSEVADLCGYNDASNFTRAFKKTFGITPQQQLDRP